MSKRQRRWGTLADLRNPAFRETVEDVKAALTREGYLICGIAGPWAFRRGLARIVKGETQWNKTRWLSICREIRRASKHTETAP